jgi:hypothetical protein
VSDAGNDPYGAEEEAVTGASGPKRAPLPGWWWRQSLRARRVIAGTIVGALIVVILALLGWLPSFGGEDDAYAEAYEFVETLPQETVDRWDALAECETNSEWRKNSGNGFFGGLQFQMSSWLEVGGEGQPDETPREEQIYRADKLRQLQGWSAWPNCASQLGLQ